MRIDLLQPLITFIDPSMAPKPAKSKKVSKALMVSTPVVLKGRMRKSNADSSKDKGEREKVKKENLLLLQP